ncbi:MAG: glutathione S-transferase [Solirubrobacterales bacterium]|jgi:glutathione S-transferase|nr:glutathione S-transferase [Solirubrobacterales bacterium]
MATKLYTMPGSHPGAAVALALERKGIPYRRIDVMMPASLLTIRLRGFHGRTVPALKIGRKRFQGSVEICRALERLEPEPPIYPADPDQRRRVEIAESWGDEVLQPAARRINVWGMTRDHAPVARQIVDSRELYDANIMIPAPLAAALAGPMLSWYSRAIGADDDRVHHDLAELPSMLEGVDAWIREGVLGGAEPNAADFQIASSVRLMMTMEDLREPLSVRPAGRLALRLLPRYPGHSDEVLPEDWLQPLRAARVVNPGAG